MVELDSGKLKVSEGISKRRTMPGNFKIIKVQLCKKSSQ